VIGGLRVEADELLELGVGVAGRRQRELGDAFRERLGGEDLEDRAERPLRGLHVRLLGVVVVDEPRLRGRFG